VEAAQYRVGLLPGAGPEQGTGLSTQRRQEVVQVDKPLVLCLLSLMPG